MTEIQNRIILVVACRPHPRNYNRHDPAQIADLRASLRIFGQVRSIVVQDDGLGGFLLVAGHGVHVAARLEEFTELRADVIPADWDDEKVLAYLAADNELAKAANADNYWEGWEPIRQYLLQSRLAMGWDVPTMKRIVGHSDLSRDHWTSKSQWSFPTRDVYEKLQAAALAQEGNAFERDYDDLKRDYDDLKRAFYATRAYFDNTHDNMTDVWRFARVTGDG